MPGRSKRILWRGVTVCVIPQQQEEETFHPSGETFWDIVTYCSDLRCHKCRPLEASFSVGTAFPAFTPSASHSRKEGSSFRRVLKHQNHREGLLEHRLPDSSPSVSEVLSLRQGLGICIACFCWSGNPTLRTTSVESLSREESNENS